MDIIEIEYNGKTLRAKNEKSKNVDSKKEFFLMRLPDLRESEFSVKKRMVKITDEYIQLISVDAKHTEEFSAVWLFSDGTIKHDDFINRMFKDVPKTADKKFDLNGENTEFPYSVAQELHEMKIKVDSILEKKRAIDAMRKKILDLKLRKLGYESQAAVLSLLRDYPTTCNLNDAVDDLGAFLTFDGFQTADILRVIPGFSKREGQDIIYTEPSEDTMHRIYRLLEETVKRYKEERDSVESEVEMTDQRRRLLEDFANRFAIEYAVGIPGILSRTDKEWKEYAEYIYMQGKKYLKSFEEKKLRGTSSNDGKAEIQRESEEIKEPTRSILVNNMIWERYTEQLRILAKVYMGLNPDLLEPSMDGEVEDFTQMERREYEDKMSGILESYQLGQAIDVENIFVIAINLDFIPQAEAILNSDPAIAMTGVGESIRELIDDSTAKIASRIECIERKRALEKDSFDPSKKKPHHDGNPGGGPGGENR